MYSYPNLIKKALALGESFSHINIITYYIPTNLPIIHLFGIHVVFGQAFKGHVFPLCSFFSVVAVRVDGEAAARQEFSPHFNVFRVHNCYQIFHDDVDAVFMEGTVVPEGEKVEFKAFAFHHFYIRYVGNGDGRKVRLSRYGAKTCKFGAVKFDEVVVVLVLVFKDFQNLRVVFVGIGHVLIA